MTVFLQKYLILLIAGFLSIILTYNYTDFSANMSVGVGHVYTAKSLALSYDFNVDEYWGNAGVDVFRYKNHYYVAYAPLNAIIMAVLYFGLQIIYYFYTNYVGNINGDISLIIESVTFSLPSTLALVLIGFISYKFLEPFRLGKEIINWLIAGLLLGTILFNYSVSFFNHNLAALFILTAFYVLVSKYYTDKFRYFISGILTTLAFLTEYPSVLFAVGVGFSELYLVKSKARTIKEAVSNMVLFAIPILVGILLLGLWHFMLFGNPFTFSETLLYQYKQGRNMKNPVFNQNPIFGIWGLYFSPIKGLFLISPFLLYFFIVLKDYIKEHKNESIMILTYIVLVSLVYSVWPDCFGATAFGPRYLISVIPFMFLITAYAFRSSNRKTWIQATKSILTLKLLILYSIFIIITNVLDGLPSGTLFNECNTFKYAAMSKAVGFYKNTFLKGLKSYRPVVLKYIGSIF